MYKFEETVLNREGQPIVGATITLFTAGTSIQAVLYEDDQSTLKANPLVTDTNGFVQAKAANGKYDFEISIGGVMFRRVNGIIFDDPSESGAAGVALSMPTEFNVTGSPGSTINVTKKNQNSNTFMAGPSAGSPNQPVYRGIVIEDLPIATSQDISGGVPNKVTSPLAVRDYTGTVGRILQSKLIPVTLTFSTTSTTYTNVTGFSDNFTPLHSDTKIRVQLGYYGANASANVLTYLQVLLNGVVSARAGISQITGGGISHGTAVAELNSPGTAQVPVSLQMRTVSSTGRLNQNSSAEPIDVTSYIVIQEIAQS